MDRITSWLNGAVPSLAPAIQIDPDAASEPSFDVAVAIAGDTTMEAQTDTTKAKKPAAKAKAKRGASTSTKFSEYCKANKVDGVKARRALRAAGMRAPYDPASKKVLDVLATL
jgi:hypothetical protein